MAVVVLGGFLEEVINCGNRAKMSKRVVFSSRDLQA